MHFPVKALVAGILFAGSFHVAHASTAEALTLLNHYNLITSGNLSSISEVDGNALIGGNLYEGSRYHTHDTSTAVSALTVAGDIVTDANESVIVNGPGLNVGGIIRGSVTMNAGGNAYIGSVASGGFLQNNANGKGSTYVVGDIAGSVNTNGGNTIYGGNLTGSANANGGGTVQQQAVTPPFNPATQVANAISTLTEYSNQLASHAENSSYSFSGNKAVFNAVGNGDGLAVFTISDANSFFNQANEFDFNIASGTRNILFNVINSDANAKLDIHANFLADAANQWGSQLLWNFENATDIAISAQFGGSLLALGADVGTDANIEGTLVANNVFQAAEIHSRPPSNVPVPGAAPLFLSALASFGAVVRRNRKIAV